MSSENTTNGGSDKTPMGFDMPVKPGMGLHANSQNITKEKLKKFLPKGSSHTITDEIINLVESMQKDTGIMQEYMEETLMANMPIISEVKVDLKDYVNAIKYCTLNKDMSNKKAWEIVFPDKMAKLQAMKLEMGDKVNIDSHVSNYNKTKIVVALETQMRLHASIMYMPYNHEAMMVRVNLMRGKGANPSDRVSPLVQLQAAEGVYADTKMPEDNTIELKMGMSDKAVSVTEGLMSQISRMADIQLNQLKAGGDIRDVQKLKLEPVIEAELDD